MKDQPYYLAYEQRYQAVFAAGAERWGHSPDDEELYHTLTQWVTDNHLVGKRIIEFACGEGAGGVILAQLGCLYHGVDISPSAIAKATEAMKDYPNATVSQLDMVKEQADGTYDAALDCMGLHMLITDADRAAYLRNACAVLNSGAPMLFYKEAYREDEHIIKVPVSSYEQWVKLTGYDYETPTARSVETEHGEMQVMLPLLPARANDREGYMREMEAAGFEVEDIVKMNQSQSIAYGASIYVKKT